MDRPVEVRAATADDAAAVARAYLSSARHHAAIDLAAYRVPPLDTVTAHYAQLHHREDAGGQIMLAVSGDGTKPACVRVVCHRRARGLLSANASAHGFYEALGYRDVGALMSKELDD